MSDPLKQALREIILCGTIPKDYYLPKAGKKCEYVYFIHRGMIKIFTKIGEKEKIIWLLKEIDIAIAFDSFFNQVPSDEYIQAIEETELGYISYDQLEELCSRFPESSYIKNHLTQLYYAQEKERSKRAHLSAAERFEYFLVRGPVRPPAAETHSLLPGSNTGNVEQVKGR